MSFLTIFSAPKPFTNPHITTIQANAIQSWKKIGAEVDVILVGEEAGLAEAAAHLGAQHLRGVARNPEGTPLVSSIFRMARENSNSPLLAYVNADILLLPDFVESARQAAAHTERFLLIGQRWDLEVTSPLDFSGDWGSRLRKWNEQQGELYPPLGSDYFIFPRACFSDIPDFAIGRAGWDNWMIYKSRREHWATIDATASILDIHQKHDYSHLPGGQAHYHLPETYENIRLAGGNLRKKFTLMDADYRLVQKRLTRPDRNARKCLREMEILPLVSWKAEWLAEPFFLVFHPRQAWQRAKEAIVRRTKKKVPEGKGR